jgi:hypothetical protein
MCTYVSKRRKLEDKKLERYVLLSKNVFDFSPLLNKIGTSSA